MTAAVVAEEHIYGLKSLTSYLMERIRCTINLFEIPSRESLESFYNCSDAVDYLP